MPSGGSRPGAGRPKGAKTRARVPAGQYSDAESYLAAVVEGTEPPDSLRIGAAKALIAYQRARQRAPVQGLRPSELARAAEVAAEDAVAAEFERRAAVIRAKHGRGR